MIFGQLDIDAGQHHVTIVSGPYLLKHLDTNSNRHVPKINTCGEVEVQAFHAVGEPVRKSERCPVNARILLTSDLCGQCSAQKIICSMIHVALDKGRLVVGICCLLLQ